MELVLTGILIFAIGRLEKMLHSPRIAFTIFIYVLLFFGVIKAIIHLHK